MTVSSFTIRNFSPKFYVRFWLDEAVPNDFMQPISEAIAVNRSFQKGRTTYRTGLKYQNTRNFQKKKKKKKKMFQLFQ